MDIERIMTARAIGMLAGLALSIVILAIRIALDPLARLGLWSLLTRRRGQ
jgi:hypothetical protein